MPDEHKNTGVEQGSDAGGQEEFNLEEILFGDDTGVDNQGDAGPEEGAEQTGEGEVEQRETPAEPTQPQDQGSSNVQLPDDGEKAFAAKWAAKEDQIREDERKKVQSELEQRNETTQKQQDQGAPKYRDMSEDEINNLAYDLDASPQLVKLLHQQQQMINRQADDVRRRDQISREQAEYNDAQKFVQDMKRQNPSMPEWDDKKLHQYRVDYYKRNQTVLPWKEAYKMAIADSVVSGDVARQAQQEAINNIQNREKEAGTLKSTATNRPTIDELPQEQFDKLVEEVKAGKYKRS